MCLSTDIRYHVIQNNEHGPAILLEALWSLRTNGSICPALMLISGEIARHFGTVYARWYLTAGTLTGMQETGGITPAMAPAMTPQSCTGFMCIPGKTLGAGVRWVVSCGSCGVAAGGRSAEAACCLGVTADGCTGEAAGSSGGRSSPSRVSSSSRPASTPAAMQSPSCCVLHEKAVQHELPPSARVSFISCRCSM